MRNLHYVQCLEAFVRKIPDLMADSRADCSGKSKVARTASASAMLDSDIIHLYRWAERLGFIKVLTGLALRGRFPWPLHLENPWCLGQSYTVTLRRQPVLRVAWRKWVGHLNYHCFA